MARIIDLDIIAPRGVTVRKDGEDYQLPGDPPVSMWLGIIAAHDDYISTSGSDQVEALQLFHDRMLELFQIENPQMTSLPFGVGGMFSVLGGFYGAELEEETDPPGADEAASTTTTKRGSASSAAKRKRPATTRSRSSRSSAR